MFELPVGSSVKSLKTAIEARVCFMPLSSFDLCFAFHVAASDNLVQYQLPQELFVLCWHERKVSWPDQGENQSNIGTPSPTILIEMNENPVQDHDTVLVFARGQATQELALENEALYTVGLFFVRHSTSLPR